MLARRLWQLQARSTAEVLYDKHQEDVKAAQTVAEALPQDASAAKTVLKVDLIGPLCSRLAQEAQATVLTGRAVADL